MIFANKKLIGRIESLENELRELKNKFAVKDYGAMREDWLMVTCETFYGEDLKRKFAQIYSYLNVEVSPSKTEPEKLVKKKT